MAYKQIIIVDDELKMPPGKLASQCVHASLAVLRKCTNTKWLSAWKAQGEAVIILKCRDAQESFQEVIHAAELLKIPHAQVTDAGLTCVAPGSTTCIAIGPAPNVMLSTFTQGYSLL